MAISKTTISEFVCDKCGQKTTDMLMLKNWVTCSIHTESGLCVFEKAKDYHYFASNLPERELKIYCSGECFATDVRDKVELFITEILHNKKTINHQTNG